MYASTACVETRIIWSVLCRGINVQFTTGSTRNGLQRRRAYINMCVIINRYTPSCFMYGRLKTNKMKAVRIISVKTCVLTSYNDFSAEISAKEQRNKGGTYLQMNTVKGIGPTSEYSCTRAKEYTTEWERETKNEKPPTTRESLLHVLI